uniref:Uncharacterized protein n=1 Tax=Nelumbo nucifera TaxID=4432 RepID=A0A822ZPJ6_NELNU|nr:TPA_asm: hypothetical protein HUJ06_001948 [Nelumbo nucifera]
MGERIAPLPEVAAVAVKKKKETGGAAAAKSCGSGGQNEEKQKKKVMDERSEESEIDRLNRRPRVAAAVAVKKKKIGDGEGVRMAKRTKKKMKEVLGYRKTKNKMKTSNGRAWPPLPPLPSLYRRCRCRWVERERR